MASFEDDAINPRSLVPDIVARIHSYTTEEGGKRKTVSATQFGCLFCFEEDCFDCRLLLDLTGQVLKPGDSALLPIKFLSPRLIRPRLQVGSVFQLWDMGIFADGRVVEIIGQKS